MRTALYVDGSNLFHSIVHWGNFTERPKRRRLVNPPAPPTMHVPHSFD